MSATPSGPDLLAARLRRLAARVRPAHVFAAAGVAGVVALAGLQAVALPGPRPLTDADRLRIEVVAPVEPEIAPGAVMDVGELVDGFKGVPRRVVQTVAYAPYEEDRYGRDAVEPSPRHRIREAVIETLIPQPEPPAARSDRDRGFGFDAPRRDYRAEREDRRARLEARMQWERDREHDREREMSRRYVSDPGRDRGYDRDRPADRDRRGDEGRWREPPPRDHGPPRGPWN